MTIIVDARGLSCPQPVLIVQQTLKSNPSGCEILVDNPAAVGNVSRFAQTAGYSVVSSEEEDGTRLIIKK